MSKTRVDSLKDTIDTVNHNLHLSNDGAIVIFLAEIAGSLAVIADCMTAKKEGDVDEYTN